MQNRRVLLAALAASALLPLGCAEAADTSFPAFIAEAKAEARRKGIRQTTIDRAFAGVKVNQKVIELDRKQPEFTMTWEMYRSRIVSPLRITNGREALGKHRALLTAVCAKYKVAPGPIMGIWGLESNYGVSTGGFHVIEALATLAWEGRRAAFFRGQLFDALKIIDAGDITPDRMTGSYAGAMGQPQFMPDSYIKLAADWNGDGKRDIWGDTGDVFASIANYLARSGWVEGAPWGSPATLPAGFDASQAGRDNRRPVADWAKAGIRPASPLPPQTQAAVVMPGGAGGEAFLTVGSNFQAIRRYNPSDFYAIAVGLIGDAVMG